MAKLKFIDWLIRHEACKSSLEWVGNRTLARAWEECERGDWMLWMMLKAGMTINERGELALVLAERVKHFCQDAGQLCYEIKKIRQLVLEGVSLPWSLQNARQCWLRRGGGVAQAWACRAALAAWTGDPIWASGAARAAKAAKLNPELATRAAAIILEAELCGKEPEWGDTSLLWTTIDAEAKWQTRYIRQHYPCPKIKVR